MRTAAAYLRCSDPRQDKSIEQQRDEIAERAARDGVAIPPENWFILCAAAHKTNYAESTIMRSGRACTSFLRGISRRPPRNLHTA